MCLVGRVVSGTPIYRRPIAATLAHVAPGPGVPLRLTVGARNSTSILSSRASTPWEAMVVRVAFGTRAITSLNSHANHGSISFSFSRPSLILTRSTFITYYLVLLSFFNSSLLYYSISLPLESLNVYFTIYRLSIYLLYSLYMALIVKIL